MKLQELGLGWRGWEGTRKMAVRASHPSGVFLGVAFPGAGAPRPPTLPCQINGVASQDMSLAETQQLIERTEGILTLLILRDHRQFLVSIPDVDSQSDSSGMDGEETRGQGQMHSPGAAWPLMHLCSCGPRYLRYQL